MEAYQSTIADRKTETLSEPISQKKDKNQLSQLPPPPFSLTSQSTVQAKADSTNLQSKDSSSKINKIDFFTTQTLLQKKDSSQHTNDTDCNCSVCQAKFHNQATSPFQLKRPANQAVSAFNTAAIQRQTETTTLQALDDELDNFNVDEERVIRLMGELDETEKGTVLSLGSFRRRTANALNVSEMVRAMQNLRPALYIQLWWVREASWTTRAIDYSDIKRLISASNQTGKNGLKNNYWKDFFVQVCTNETIIEALNDLGFDLATKLEWLKAEVFTVRMEIGYNMIQNWVTSASQTERDALKTNTWREFFVQVCTNATMKTALTDLNFDLVTTLNWMKAEVFSTRMELNYNDIQSFIARADQTQKDALKTAGWLAFFVQLCTNATMLTALADLGFDLKTKIDWCLEEGGVALAKRVIEAASQTDRDAVWGDDAYLRSLHGRLEVNDYLWILVKLRMYASGTSTMTPAVDADTAISTHLSSYVGGAVRAGRQIAGQVAVVTGWNWDVTGQNTYGSRWASKKSRLNGFVDDEGRVWINPNMGNAGTMIHEALHKYSADSVRGFCWNMNEGMTEYFTRQVMTAEGLSLSMRAGIYDNQRRVVVQLVSVATEATVADCFFNGNNDALENAVTNSKGETAWSSLVSNMNEDKWRDAISAIS